MLDFDADFFARAVAGMDSPPKTTHRQSLTEGLGCVEGCRGSDRTDSGQEVADVDKRVADLAGSPARLRSVVWVLSRVTASFSVRISLLLKTLEVRHNLPSLLLGQMRERWHAAPDRAITQYPKEGAGRSLAHFGGCQR
jgi:hypothetical protein